MHGSHLRLCAVGLVLAMGYLVVSGGSAGGVGVLIAALVCPLAMVVAMAVLMGHDRTKGATGDGSERPRAHTREP